MSPAPISSPVSSDGFPSSTTSRGGYDENNFHFQPKAWPTTTSTTTLSIQTNPQTAQHPWKPSNESSMPTTTSPSLPPRSMSGVKQQKPHYQTSPGRVSAGSTKPSVRELVSAVNAAANSNNNVMSHHHHHKDPRQALAPRNSGTSPQLQHSASAAALESLEAVRRESDAWQQPPQQQQRAASISSGRQAQSNNSTPLRSRDAPYAGSDSPSLASAGGGGAMDAWMTENTGEPDDLEQALFEQRLTEDIYGVAVRKINHNGKSNLRYVKCSYVDAADLEVDAHGFSSSRSISSQSRASRARLLRFRDRGVMEPSETLMKGKKVKVLTWGKKKEVHLPLERFVCVRKGKTTERTRRNICPASRIVSLITDDPNCPSLDIEAPTRLDRDKFAKAFARFLAVPLEGGDDVRSIRSDMTPQSLKDPPGSTSSHHQRHQAVFTARQLPPDPMSGANSHVTNNSNSRKHIPLPMVTADNNNNKNSSSHSRKGLPFPQPNKFFTSGRMVPQEPLEALNNVLDAPDPQITSLPSTYDSKDVTTPIAVTSSREPSAAEHRSQPAATGLNVPHQNDEEGSVVSSITGVGFDQELVEELHMALTELRAELEESRAEAARAVKVAEQAIQSAENSNSKDWNSTVTHKAAEAAALAQKRSAEALAKARMAEERLDQERKKAAIWRKQAETAAEEAGHWQTRAAVAEVQRAAMAEHIESERQRASKGVVASSTISNSNTGESELDRLRSRLAAESATRRRLLNEVQDLRGAIRVYCRPKASKGTSAVSTPSQEVLMLHRERASLKTTENDSTTTTPLSFEFDGILGTDASQREVYEEMEAVCLSALDGYNVCLMTYGQQGAGKTYTMLGKVEYGTGGDVSISDYGIHLQAAKQFFSVMHHRKDRYKEAVTFNIVEVSNERLVDLLVGTDIGDSQGRVDGTRSTGSKSGRRKGDDGASASCSEKPTRLEIKTNRDGETTVHGLLSVDVTCFEDVINIWEQCLSKRKERLAELGFDFDEHETNCHVIGTFKILSKNIATGVTTKGKIQFVDLAASNVVPRRITGKTTASSTPEAVIAGIGIGPDWKFANRSMATLSEVMSARSQFQRSVPYRNATITHLLSDSLEADTKVVLVACVSSELRDLQETACTLKFAQTVRKVVVGKATKHTNAHTI